MMEWIAHAPVRLVTWLTWGRARPDPAKVRKALERIAAPMDCGCYPCTGQCRGPEAMRIWFEEAQERAREALRT
jgi:hypothetical protein